MSDESTSPPIGAAVVPPGGTVPMFSPDGNTVGDVPSDRVSDAVSKGFRIGQDMVHAKTGKVRTVPFENVQKAIQSGEFHLAPPSISGSIPKPPNPILNAPEESGLETGPLLSGNQEENKYDPIVPKITDPTGRTLARELNSTKESVLGAIPAVFHAAFDKPKDATEEAIANTNAGVPIPSAIKLAAYRTAKPVANAVQDYAGGKVSADDALSVLPEALGQAGGQVVAGKLGDSLTESIPKLTEPIKDYVPQRLYNAIVGTKPKGFNYGRNPGQGVADSGLVAWSKDSMLDKIRDQQAQTGKGIQLHLSDPAVNKPVVDLRASINDPINQMETAAIKGKNLDLADRLADLRDRLNNDYARGPNGKLTPTGPTKLSQLTPLEANAIKQDIGEMTRWTGDPKVDAMSPAIQQIYGRINNQIEQAAPGIKGINQKYGELKSASEALDNKIRLGSKYNPYGSLTDILSGMKWGPSGYVASKIGRSTPGMSIIAQAANRLPTEVPAGLPPTINAAIAAPKEKK